jgi:hypothetical protein
LHDKVAAVAIAPTASTPSQVIDAAQMPSPTAALSDIVTTASSAARFR